MQMHEERAWVIISANLLVTFVTKASLLGYNPKYTTKSKNYREETENIKKKRQEREVAASSLSGILRDRASASKEMVLAEIKWKG